MLIKDKKYFIFKNEKGEKYLSFAKILKPFKVEKDWDEICRKTAKKRGIPYEDLKKQWDEAAETSKRRGVIYHDSMESFYKRMAQKGRKIFFTDKTSLIYKDCKLEDNSAYIEKLIWDDEFKVFGFADFIQIKDGKAYLIDYKTNKSIDFEAFGDERMLGPLSNLPDANYFEYCLQCSLYMWIILKSNPNLKFGEMYLEHVRFDENDKVIEKIKIPVEFYEKEIEEILKQNKQ